MLEPNLQPLKWYKLRRIGMNELSDSESFARVTNSTIIYWEHAQAVSCKLFHCRQEKSPDTYQGFSIGYRCDIFQSFFSSFFTFLKSM